MKKEELDYAIELVGKIAQSLAKAKRGSMAEDEYLHEKTKALYELFGGEGVAA